MAKIAETCFPLVLLFNWTLLSIPDCRATTVKKFSALNLSAPPASQPQSLASLSLLNGKQNRKEFLIAIAGSNVPSLFFTTFRLQNAKGIETVSASATATRLQALPTENHCGHFQRVSGVAPANQTKERAKTKSS